MNQKDKSLIPTGPYCYTYVDGKFQYCPFFTNIEDEGVSLPFCNYLEMGGIDNEASEESFDILEKKYGSADAVFEKYPLMLLWDSVKECGENDEYDA